VVHEIDRKTELSDGDQTERQIRSQQGESVFVSTEDYSLAGGNEDFVVSEESSRESSLFRS